MTPELTVWTDDVGHRVLDGLRVLESSVPLQPKQISISQFTNALNEDGWLLTLVLPAPDGQTWDSGEVYSVRRAAIEIFDEFAAAEGHTLEGLTMATITTDEASEADTAPDEEPEPDEDPISGR